MHPFLLHALRFLILHFLISTSEPQRHYLILNFNSLLNYASSTCLGFSTLHLRDKLLSKGMEIEVQILS